VWTVYDPKVQSVEGAQQIFNEQAETLMMDHSSYILWGEHGKTLILLADAYYKNSTKDLSTVTFNATLFVLSLVLIFSVFYILRMPLLGFILTTLLGSNPYQLYEVYVRENIFSLNISVLILLLAINLPLFKNNFETIKKSFYYLLFATGLSGLLLGTMSHIRAEAISTILSCFVIYIFIPKFPVKLKIIGLIMILVSFMLTTRAWEYYFNIKFDEAYAAVDKVKEAPIDAPTFRENYHTFWHPVLAGFHDFDNKYGYKWDDNYAYNLAAPILLKNYPDKYNIQQNRETWSVRVEYKEIIRKHVLDRIIGDPKWYGEILYKRFEKMLNTTVPVGVYLDGNFYGIPFVSGWLFIPILLFFVYKRDWFWVKLLAFSLPASLLGIIIHASHNVPMASIYHIFAFTAVTYYLANHFFKSVKILLNHYYGSEK
jgi:hypothetical protein